MLTTRLCTLLGIEHPIVQGPLGGPFEIGAELVAAMSRAGGLGSVATALRSPDEVRDDIAAIRELAGGRPFRRQRHPAAVRRGELRSAARRGARGRVAGAR